MTALLHYWLMNMRGGENVFRDFLRKEDLKSADAVDVFVANSHFVAERIRRIYGREAEVVGSGETNPR